MKLFQIVLFLFVVTSCGVNNRRRAAETIVRFEQSFVPDKRETVFNVSAGFRKGQVLLAGETDSPQLLKQLIDSLHPVEVHNEVVILPDSTVSDKPYALISVSAANMRSGPVHTSELVTQAILGTPVKILKKENGWYLIQTPDKYISWIDSGGMSAITKEDLQKWQLSDRMLFTGPFVHIYETPDMQQPVGDVTMGGILSLKEKSGNFLKVAFPDGREGFTQVDQWIDFSDFKNITRPDSVSVVKLALNMKGSPYLWGGTSFAGMDCSGFTKMVYFMNGVILSRDASLQARNGIPVEPGNDFENLKPGDLLFFGQKAKENVPEKITHVAISLGKTEYIHASGMVGQNSFNMLSDLYSEYRKNTFVRARRIIGSEGSRGVQLIKENSWY